MVSSLSTNGGLKTAIETAIDSESERLQTESSEKADSGRTKDSQLVTLDHLLSNEAIREMEQKKSSRDEKKCDTLDEGRFNYKRVVPLLSLIEQLMKNASQITMNYLHCQLNSASANDGINLKIGRASCRERV